MLQNHLVDNCILTDQFTTLEKFSKRVIEDNETLKINEQHSSKFSIVLIAILC
jgi:hypothetical protein